MSNRPRRHSVSVTIVDDNMLNRKVLDAQLRRSSLDLGQITQACDGSEVLSPKSDVIFMDVEMPGVNGIEATKKIRKKSLELDSHVLIIGYSSEPKFKQECIEAGMDDFLQKPATREQISNILEKHIK